MGTWVEADSKKNQAMVRDRILSPTSQSPEKEEGLNMESIFIIDHVQVKKPH